MFNKLPRFEEARLSIMSKIKYFLALQLILTGCNRQDPISYTLYHGSRSAGSRTIWATFDASRGSRRGTASINQRNCKMVATALNASIDRTKGQEFWCEASARS